MKTGVLRSFFLEGHPTYLNEYPFEVGDDHYPMADSAEEQLRMAMSVVSNHSERVQIAAKCHEDARPLALRILAEWEGGAP
jgi:hypothetical protein